VKKSFCGATRASVPIIFSFGSMPYSRQRFHDSPAEPNHSFH
jgi:hypothetical protein